MYRLLRSLLDCDDGIHMATANANTSWPQYADDDREDTITGGHGGRVDDDMGRGGTASMTTPSTHPGNRAYYGNTHGNDGASSDTKWTREKNY